MTRHVFTFPSSCKEAILKALGVEVRALGLLFDKKTGEQIYTRDAEEVTIDAFAAVKKGSLVFLKSDLPSLIQLADELE